MCQCVCVCVCVSIARGSPTDAGRMLYPPACSQFRLVVPPHIPAAPSCALPRNRGADARRRGMVVGVRGQAESAGTRTRGARGGSGKRTGGEGGGQTEAGGGRERDDGGEVEGEGGGGNAVVSRPAAEMQAAGYCGVTRSNAHLGTRCVSPPGRVYFPVVRLGRVRFHDLRRIVVERRALL